MKRAVFHLSLAALGAGLVLGFSLGFQKTPGGGHPAGTRAPSHRGDSVRESDEWTAPIAGTSLAATEAIQLLGQVQSTADPAVQSDRLDDLCAGLDVAGVRALMAVLAEKRSPSEIDQEIMERLAARWAEIDPRAAAEYAVATGNNRYSLIYEVMWVWARSDPGAARAWALEASGTDGRRYGLNAIVQVVAESDPQAALKLIEDLPARDRSFCSFSMFGDLALKNPTLAAELAVQVSPGPERRAALNRVAEVWGQAAPDKALAWYVRNTSPYERKEVQGEVVSNLVKAWVQKAPEEAAGFAAAQPPGSLRSDLISDLGTSWGAIDPQAAATWLLALPKSSESVRGFDHLITSWAENEPVKAGDFLLAQPAERSRDWSLSSLGWAWAEKDPEAALAWARRQNAPEVERRVAAIALGTMAAKDLPHAADYLAQLKTPEALAEAMVKITNAIGRRDPEAAVAWVAQQPDSAASGRAIEFPVNLWAASDADGVTAWLNEQPAGPRKDAAVGAFVSRIAEGDGAGAAMWASTIADEALRARRLDEVLGTWAKVNSTAASAWVEQQHLPEPRQKELQKLVDRASRK